MQTPSPSQDIPYRIHPEGFDAACRSLDRKALALLAVGVAGILFSVFWLVFAVILRLIPVGTLAISLLLGVVGGLLPLVGCAIVVWRGIVMRLRASHLRDLLVLSHGRAQTTATQVAQRLCLSLEDAEELLSIAAQRGLASPVFDRRG